MLQVSGRPSARERHAGSQTVKDGVNDLDLIAGIRRYAAFVHG
jgi:hypothetical protein